MKEDFGVRASARMLHLIKTKKDAFWSRVRQQQPLKLFHEVARRVPAYKDFLKKQDTRPEMIPDSNI